ncbi:zinc finger protein 16-like [Artemia franciscana]|uniref:zinc finger protein 16-like n=1 Tax=Artemia franciscana TaxID=6661 RepID=UPI0032DB3468
MAENLALSESSDIKKEVDDPLPSNIKKQVDILDPLLFPKREDCPMRTFSSILVPCKIEPDSQEFGSTSPTDQGVMNSTICSNGSVSQPKLWRCNSCGKTETSFLILDLHIDTGCEELSPIECDICPAVIRDYKDFVAHFMEHQMGETRRCPICLQNNIDNVKEHLILQGHFSQNKFETELQGATSKVTSQKLFTSVTINTFELNSRVTGQNDKKNLLSRHSHNKTFRKHHECNICKMRFPTKCKLKMHQGTHRGSKSFKCNICEKVFSVISNLNRHQRRHTSEKSVQCDICQKTFARLANLAIHKRVHTGEKPFQCDICEKTFAQSGTLAAHNRVHTGEKPFQCNICKKNFALSGNLVSHKRVHTGEKPFQCDICNKTFAQSPHLVKHKRIHTGEKPFQCNICKKAFAMSGELTRHKRVHTGEKPFQCDICKKTFTQSPHLIKHKRVHTRE